MKSLVFLLIGAFIFAQYSDASPRLHLRAARPGLRLPRSTELRSFRVPRAADTSNEADLTKREKILVYGVVELVGIAKFTIDMYKEFFDNIVKSANKKNLNTGALRNELKNFSDFNKKIDNLPSEESEEYADKLFDLFGECFELSEKYDLDNISNPTNEQRQIARLFEENGELAVNMQFLLYFSGMQTRFTVKVQEYIDSLTPQERREDAKMINWFNTFKRQTDFEKKLDIMMEFFSLFEDE